MQSKGAIKLVAVLLALACVWQLSFTLVTSIQENKAAKYAQNAVEVYKQSAEFAEIPEVDKAYVLDSIAKKENRWYIDSISSEKVYFRYTYKDVKSKEINLGLDLKGGMNVMLQVQLEDLVKALAGENRTPEFEKAISLAKERSVKSPDDFITLFAQAWKEVSNGQRLAQVFGTYDLAKLINPQSTDEEVLSVIRENAESAVANSFNVLRNRIDRFGVTQPSIQRLGNSGRILVELPGVISCRELLPLSSGPLMIIQKSHRTSRMLMPFSPRLLKHPEKTLQQWQRQWNPLLIHCLTAKSASQLLLMPRLRLRSRKLILSSQCSTLRTMVEVLAWVMHLAAIQRLYPNSLKLRS